LLGIYEDNFVEYLREHLGDPIKTTPKNIVCRCPWCETGEDKSHYHLWIGLDSPIFHCFHAGCEQKGTITKLVRFINGADPDKFVNKERVKASIKNKLKFERNIVKPQEIKIPPLNTSLFQYKYRYIQQRLKFANISISNIKGLIFDVNSFIELNQLPIDPTLFRIRDFLHSNFVGFLTENKSVVILRNIDPKSSFRYYKLRVQDSKFLDYYKLPGNKRFSTHIVLAEGIFDIYSEHIFDITGMKSESCLYAAGLSTSYHALVKSIALHESIFRANVHILSDRNVDLDYYKKIKKYNGHIIDTMTVYYNRLGKDFNDTPIDVEKFII